MGCLYRLTFPSGKSYIGISATTAAKRFAAHVYDSRRKNRDTPLGRAISKYGKSSAVVETLVLADKWDYLCDLERKAIAALETMAPAGYNLTAGGEGCLGRVQGERQRRLVSQALKGRVRSAEHSANIAAAKRGVPLSDYHKARIGEGSRGHVLSAEGREKVAASKRGIPRSEETKAKLRAANLGKKRGP